MNKFNFGKKKESEVDKSLEHAQNLHAKALEDARQCLHSKPFKKFVEQYEVAERQTINVLIAYAKEESDPLKFGQRAKDLLMNIAHLKAMLDAVHLNAGEKYGTRKKD